MFFYIDESILCYIWKWNKTKNWISIQVYYLLFPPFIVLKLKCWIFCCRLWKTFIFDNTYIWKKFLFICLLNLCCWNINRFVGIPSSFIFSEKINSFYTNPLFLLNCRGKGKVFLGNFLYFFVNFGGKLIDSL